MHACSVVSDSATPWTIALQVHVSMGFSRKEDWSGLLFHSPGDLPMFVFKDMELYAEKKWATQSCLVLGAETWSAEYKQYLHQYLNN